MHQDIPFEKLVDELNVEKDVSRHPVFQTFFSISDYNPENQYNSFSIIDTAEYYKPAKFDFSMFIDTAKNNFECSFEFATSLFELTTIKRMANHFTNILHSFVSKLETPIQKLNILSEDEFQTIVYDWNKTETPYPSNKTVHALFEEQVKKTPDNIAVVFKDQKITYRELNNRANQLAHTIRKEYKNHWNIEIEGDTLIGIYIDRSIEMIISILGILKAGAAYVPFDRADPEERLKFKINDCKCRMILTSTKIVENLVFLTESDTLPVSIDSYWTKIAKAPSTTPKHINNSTNLCYVIYTSGSTGNPKGVLQSHHNINRLFLSCNKLFNFTKNDVWTLFHSISFDFSVWELWGALLYGGKIVLPTFNCTRNSPAFIKLLISKKISILNQTPSAFIMLNNYISDYNNKLSLYLKYIIFGGEALNTNNLIKLFLNPNFNQTKIINMYGITETTVHVTHKVITQKDITNSLTSNIGIPLADLKCYILDKNLSPVPIGAIGELYIGGRGLARGYLNNDLLTKERFILSPYVLSSNKYNRLYKTGDLAKFLKNGEIEYIGRNDRQIQIRGYRIELGEIEIVLSGHTAIKQCYISYQKINNHKSLVAYYILKKTARLNYNLEEELKYYLSKKLPNYMLPHIFIKVEVFVLNSNGKMNEKELIKISNKATQEKIFTPPRNKLEKQLTTVWKKVLTCKNLGIDDDFFKLGGNSILAIKLLYSINESTHLNIKLYDIFKCRTIKNLLAMYSNKEIQVIDVGEL